MDLIVSVWIWLYQFLTLGSPSPFLYLLKWSSAHVYARGRKQCCNFYYCLWRVSIKPRHPSSIWSMFFVSKGNLFFFFFFGLSAVKRLPVFYHSADYTFLFPLGSLGSGLCGSVGCAVDWRPGGRGFNPRRGRQHSFVEIDDEIFSTVILSLPLI